MARPPDHKRRQDLLLGALTYAAQHGLADLSLRPLARALGTSDRMLLHYFGTKDELIGQALVASRPDVRSLVGRQSLASVGAGARVLWKDMVSGGDQEPRVRLLLEVLALAMSQPDLYGEHARRAIADWVAPLADALRSLGMHGDAEARATLLVDGLRGLALDYYVTGDRARVSMAAEFLIASVTATS
jgi:AcrR family transcriptional regulator